MAKLNSQSSRALSPLGQAPHPRTVGRYKLDLMEFQRERERTYSWVGREVGVDLRADAGGANSKTLREIFKELIKMFLSKRKCPLDCIFEMLQLLHIASTI